MPRYPDLSSSLVDVGGAVFSSLANRMATHDLEEVYPLHVGDTWLEPVEGCRMQDLSVDEYPGMHRYADPQGMPGLLDVVVERVRRRTGAPTERGNVLITTGATGALATILGTVLEPGNQVIVLAPYWPLITGIVRCLHGEPVVVPIIGATDSAGSAVERVDRALTPRCAALYLSTPNNPTGKLLPRSWIEALVEWAVARDLWIVADEVYEDYVFTGEHTYARPLAPQQTFSAHSFSKAFGMAGNRCGYAVGPAEVMGELRKVGTHSFYSTPTASQLAAVRALDGRGDRWIDDVREQYRATGVRVANRLGVDPPEGSTFLFLNVARGLDDRGLLGFLEDCADRGLFLAPGPSFGPYPDHVRICFTSATPEIVDRGVEILATRLGL